MYLGRDVRSFKSRAEVAYFCGLGSSVRKIGHVIGNIDPLRVQISQQGHL